MAEGHLVKVVAITAADNSGDRHIPAPKMPQHHRIACPNAVIADVQQPQPVIAVNIHTGIIQHQIRVVAQTCQLIQRS